MIYIIYYNNIIILLIYYLFILKTYSLFIIFFVYSWREGLCVCVSVYKGDLC